ncbi:MAG: hypothetical protein JW913_00775 [Chitinispirillaceae bacterium]|nr:hypothetical protein [Chitinispirillaceae bacterium]
MELKLVMVVVKLIDICAFPLHDVPNLIIVESGDRIAGRKNTQESYWHRYSYSSAERGWHARPQITRAIPLCGVIKASSYNNRFYSVLQSNVNDALIVVTTAQNSDAVFRSTASVAVNLSDEAWMAIEIPQGGAWSTPFLSMERCMFNPHILAVDDNKTIVVANAVDASARLFMVSDDVQEIAKIDRCIEPCVIGVAGKKMIVFRRCPENWLVFHNQPNTRMAPELLPLVVYTLDDDYSVTETIQLSKGWYTATSFGFDACSTGDNAIILATVTGHLKKTQLQVLVSLDRATTWKERTVIQLDEVPFRVRVAATEKRILTACTFKRHDGYHVMAAEFDR